MKTRSCTVVLMVCDQSKSLYWESLGKILVRRKKNQKLYGSADGLWSERKVSQAEISGE